MCYKKYDIFAKENVKNINILGFIKILKLTLVFNINKRNFIASGSFCIQHKFY